MREEQQATHDIARERLRAVLEMDRGHLTGKALDLFKRDIASVTSSYMEVREEDVEVEFERDAEGASVMIIRQPVGKLRRLPQFAEEES